MQCYYINLAQAQGFCHSFSLVLPHQSKLSKSAVIMSHLLFEVKRFLLHTLFHVLKSITILNTDQLVNDNK